MSTLTASLGISQIQKLDKIIKMRQKNAHYISSRIKNIDEIEVPNPPKNYDHIYQMYSIKLKEKSLRDNLQEFLTQKRIFSKVYFLPIHQTEYYRKKLGYKESLPITNDISERILTLPMYPNMTKEEKSYLINSVLEFFEQNQLH